MITSNARVGPESQLWEKNPMLQQGAELDINSMLDQMLNPQSYIPATGYIYISQPGSNSAAQL